ncbi:MAG: hypothetical protein V4565_03880 [Bacteroidota bacterium]
MSQTTLNESLVVIAYDASGKEDLKQIILKYNFVNYVFSGKDTIMRINGKRNGKDYLRFDDGENKLYQNRYLISSKGCILDLQTKEVLRDAPAKVVKLTNDSIIYFINDVFSGSYYSLYNLTSRKYSDISQPGFKPLIGQNIEIDQQISPYKLIYFPEGKAKVILMEDAGHGGVSSQEKKSEVPVYWIDNNSFMFPNIKITDLEGNIIKYDLTLKTQKIIGSFSSSTKMPATLTFTRINNALVEFSFKDKYYLINPLKETMLAIFYKDFEYNYSVSTELKAASRTIYHKGIEIGKNYFELHNFKSSNNHAAIMCNVKMGGSLSKREISIYSVFKAKWENLYVDHLVSIAGWVIN